MIIMKGAMLMIEGKDYEVITEGTLILHSIYEKLVKDGGKEYANEILVEMGKIAVMEDLSEVGIGSITLGGDE